MPGQHDGTPDPHLAALRAEIDRVDHEVLRQLALRAAIVRRIAEHKRASGLPLRDPARETHILSDRGTAAGVLNLPAHTVESLWRTILAASRDLQASMRVGIPAADAASHRIAIVGGRGGMGRLFDRLLSGLGHEVLVSDLDTALTPEDAARAADICIVSVPIDQTSEVIHRVGPHLRPGSLLMDLTSIKVPPVQEMLRAGASAVIGAHPLFGPSVHTVQGQRIALCPARPGTWLDWARQTFSALGMIVVECDAEEHDRVMSIVQVLTHFATEVTGAALASLDVPIERTLEFTSPVYQMELYMTARHFAQSPALYAAIQMSNPATPAVVRAFIAAAEAQHAALSAGDRDAFRTVFERVRARLGPLTARAMSESSFLIDRLVERS